MAIPLTDLLNNDGTVKSTNEILQLPALQGLTAEQQIALLGDTETQITAPDPGRPDFFARAATSFAHTPEGMVNILSERGYDAQVTPDGVMVTTEQGTRRLDPEGFDIGDIADWAGEVLPVGGGILGEIGGGALGAMVSGGAASWPLALAGSAAGEAAGETAQQYFGRLLGSGEDYSGKDISEAALWGAGGKVGGDLLRAGVNKLAAPFRSGVGGRLDETVTDPARALDKAYPADPGKKGLEKALPLSARTDSPTLQAAEQRMGEIPGLETYMERQVREPWETATKATFKKIGEGVGRKAAGREATGEGILAAATKALEARKQQVNQAYKRAEELIDPDAPMNPEETLQSLNHLLERTMVDLDLELPSATVEKLRKIQRDLSKLTSFREFDGYRKVIGDALDEKASRAFTRHGADAQLSNLYGAITRDLDAHLIHQGEKAAQWSPITSAGGRLADPQIATETAETAAKIPQAAKKAKAMAKERFLIEDKASVNRLLTDPDAMGNVIPKIMGGTFQPGQIRRLKQRLGASTGESGLTTTFEGGRVWRAIQAQVLTELREKSIKRGREKEQALSGASMLSAIKQMGGLPKLEAIFGKDLANNIFSFANMLRDADVAERFANRSGTGRANMFMQFMGDLLRSPATLLGKGVAMAGMAKATAAPAGTRTRQWLTEGFGQGPTSQNILKTLGSIGARGGIHAWPKGDMR